LKLLLVSFKRMFRPVTKPLVRYRPMNVIIEVGLPALVKTVDHPSPLVSNTKAVLTSPVIHVDEHGFETLNTRYIMASPLN